MLWVPQGIHECLRHGVKNQQDFLVEALCIRVVIGFSLRIGTAEMLSDSVQGCEQPKERGVLMMGLCCVIVVLHMWWISAFVRPKSTGLCTFLLRSQYPPSPHHHNSGGL